MLKCSTSLWSADLANLASEIKRVEPYSERFHFDVADGHYVKKMIFFPDLVKALRKHTKLPFEVHLMTVNPLDWIEPFVEAGADLIIFSFDSAKDPKAMIKAIKSYGKGAGVALLVSEPVELLKLYWDDLDMVVIIGTTIGTKGTLMEPFIPDKIRQAKEAIKSRGLKTEVEADGGIRRETVPLICAAGADFIVPGSLMFGGDPKEMRKWLRSL